MVDSKKLNIIRQKKRSVIQVLATKYPNLKNKEIAKIIGTSSMTVSRWKNRTSFTDKKRKRPTKMSKIIKNYLIRKAKNQFTGINNASTRKLSQEIKRKFNIDVSHVTINFWLQKILKKPIKAKKTFYLRNKDKRRRLEFLEMIKQKNISGKDIFFTDEKRFILNSPLNRQTNQIRLDNKGFQEYKKGEGSLYEKICKPIQKFPKGIMVAAGLSRNGVGNLIFVTGTMTGFSYLQTLQIYKSDIERLNKNLYLQQDNAPCHVGKKCTRFINQNFDNFLEFWPPNSPDLSPNEELWAIVAEKLNCYTFNSLEEMTKKLLWLWNRIPKSVCKNLIDSFDKKIQLLSERNGERVNIRKHLRKKANYTWRNAYNKDSQFHIVYNEKVLENMKKNKIKLLNKQLKEIKSSFIEEKKRYCGKNKQLIKRESNELYKFFLRQEKEMVKMYEDKIKNKEEEIRNFNELNGDSLFNKFTLEEKINNIRLNSKNKKSSSNLSTDENSS